MIHESKYRPPGPSQWVDTTSDKDVSAETNTSICLANRCNRQINKLTKRRFAVKAMDRHPTATRTSSLPDFRGSHFPWQWVGGTWLNATIPILWANERVEIYFEKAQVFQIRTVTMMMTMTMTMAKMMTKMTMMTLMMMKMFAKIGRCRLWLQLIKQRVCELESAEQSPWWSSSLWWWW